MFVRTVKNNSGQAYQQLVESYRNEKGQVRQRVLLSLGKVGEGRLENLFEALARHQKQVTALNLAKHLSVSDTFILGPLLIVSHAFEVLGIGSVLKGLLQKHPKFKIDVWAVVFTMVVCRFVKPGSKLKIFEHWQRKFYPEMISGDLSLHELYRALDFLAQHKEEIEKRLYWHGRDLLHTYVDVVLYDLTTLRFESTKESEQLRRFGYSKEMRTDCTQVVLGLLLDTEGIPLGFEVYPGNTFEGKTLSDIVKKMREKFKIRRFIFVGDRGLFSSSNLEELRKDQGEFIVGMKLGVFKKRHEEFYDRSRFCRLNESLEVYETTHGEDRAIITWSKARFERDQKTRNDILEKIRKKLAQKNVTAKTFISNRNYQHYVTGTKEGKPLLNEKAIGQDQKKDGFFGVITNVKDLPAQEIVYQYKELWKIEDAFGELKGFLKARPVFHWTDRRIIGHLTMCFLAYLCEAYMTKTLRQKTKLLESDAIDQKIIRPRPLTVVEAMRELVDVRAIPVQIQEQTIWVRTDITGNAAKLFQTLGMKIPPKILKCSGTNSISAY